MSEDKQARARRVVGILDGEKMWEWVMEDLERRSPMARLLLQGIQSRPIAASSSVARSGGGEPRKPTIRSGRRHPYLILDEAAKLEKWVKEAAAEEATRTGSPASLAPRSKPFASPSELLEPYEPGRLLPSRTMAERVSGGLIVPLRRRSASAAWHVEDDNPLMSDEDLERIGRSWGETRCWRAEYEQQFPPPQPPDPPPPPPPERKPHYFPERYFGLDP